MDSEKFKAAMTIDPARAIEAFTDEELLAAVAARQLNVAGDVGPAATQGAAEGEAVVEKAYEDVAEGRYEMTQAVVEGHIANGKLPESYLLPELDESGLWERIDALAPTYEFMQKTGWQPEVVFVPKGLSFEQWNALLTGHDLGNGKTSEGIWRSWAEYEDSLTDPTADERTPATGLWDVAVISAADRPVFVKVSPDGKNGPDSWETVKALHKLPLLTESTSAEKTIAKTSPSQDVYLALQWARLEAGEQPVDAQTWTILKEDITVDGEVRSLIGRWDPNFRTVRSYWYYRDGWSGSDGVRPSARGEDLVLEPQA